MADLEDGCHVIPYSHKLNKVIESDWQYSLVAADAKRWERWHYDKVSNQDGNLLFNNLYLTRMVKDYTHPGLPILNG